VLHTVAYLREEFDDYVNLGKPEQHIWRNILVLKLWVLGTTRLPVIPEDPHARRPAIPSLLPRLHATVRALLAWWRTKDEPLEFDIGIHELLPPQPVGRTWVRGCVGPYYFNALVFPEHALNPSYEIGRSRISKLYLERLSDGKVVYNWDRGLDVPSRNKATRRTVSLLADKLASMVFPNSE
jgi:hypothetical protein